MDARSLRVEIAEKSGGTSPRPLHDHVLRRLGRQVPLNDVLDFGAGTGGLANRLIELAGVKRVVAADLVAPPPDPTNVAEWVVADLNEPLPFAAESFDALVAVGVLEYLEDPYATAREWVRLLRPGGAVVFTVPNTESIRSLLSVVLRGRAAAVAPDVAGPSYAFMRSDLLRVLARAGFTCVAIEPSGSGLVPRARRLTWQQLTLGSCRGVRTSDDLVASARKPAKA